MINDFANKHKVLGGMAAIALVVLGSIIGFLVGLSGGGDIRDPASGPTVGSLASRASETECNEADVRFAQMMVPHHTQALDMAKLASTRAGSAQVKALAARIETAPQPEIDKMNGWLTAWAAVAGTKSDMNGMMTEDKMTSLEALSGREFDKAFLTMMVQHHTGAIGMAQDELENGESADALALAAAIEVTQQAEINQMEALMSS